MMTIGSVSVCVCVCVHFRNKYLLKTWFDLQHPASLLHMATPAPITCLLFLTCVSLKKGKNTC